MALPNKETAQPSIPVVDLSLPLPEVGQAVHLACSTVGFFHLVNHGVPTELCNAVLREARAMFDLPQADKDAISICKSRSYRGYQRVGQNITKKKSDGHEALDLFSESKRAKRDGAPTNYGQNQWPDPKVAPQLRLTVEQYIDQLELVGKRLLRATALGLGLRDINFFAEHFTDPFWILRLIHYPPANDSDNFELGCGEHTDYGIFTMILCDEVSDTLQIRPKSETEWVTVDPVPDGFICNIGDMLSRWTNGIYVSTPHRVLRPRDSNRISVPYFYEPNYDALVSPIDELVTKSGRPPCFEATRYGDYLLAKTSTNFAY